MWADGFETLLELSFSRKPCIIVFDYSQGSLLLPQRRYIALVQFERLHDLPTTSTNTMMQIMNRPITARLGGSAAQKSSNNNIINSTRRPLSALKPRSVRVRAAENEARPTAVSLMCGAISSVHSETRLISTLNHQRFDK